MKKSSLYILASFFFLSQASFCQPVQNKPVIPMPIDGLIKKQQLDGIGVNVNTRSWNGKELEPALLLLLDTMKVTIWRVIVETVEKWEDVNDNKDPLTFNWPYYDSLYETPKFQKVWEMMAWLNHHGITKNLMINFMGYIPKWMGEETINPGMDEEYVEMLASFFYYAKNKKRLQFGLISPTNESDWRKEGPKLDPRHYAIVMRKLIDRMASLGMGDVQYVGPDPADMKRGIKEYIPELMKDPLIMAKMAHFGVHSYGGYYADIDSALKHSAYPHSGFWVTEWNEWRDGLDDGVVGVNDYNFAAECVNHLLDLLQHGATGMMVWEGYDSYYEHHAPSPFSYWGILAYDHQHKTYSPRKHLYAISQVSAFIKSGSWQTGNAISLDSVRVLSFYDSTSQSLVITGINRRKTPLTLEIALANLPAIHHLELYYTNEQLNFQRNTDIIVSSHHASPAIPANCIFTLKAKMVK
ncbi:MAG: hypothetical protein JWM28_2249 [Chitinophagaceae bacterium]|nr:hypothetical protein [Chitinophagaceae bacterium]